MIAWLKKNLEVFNLAGGVIMGIWTLNVILMCWAMPLLGKMIDGNVVALYGIAVGAFAVSKTVVKVKGNGPSSTVGTGVTNKKQP